MGRRQEARIWRGFCVVCVCGERDRDREAMTERQITSISTL